MPRIAALDIGDATVGIAVSDELQISANPVTTVHRTKSVKADIRTVFAQLADLAVDEVVIGLPLDMEHKEGDQAKKVREFADRLSRRMTVPIVFWDESYSTQDAEQALIEIGMSREKRRSIIDKMAAKIILESYLHGKNVSENKKA